jgi:hypothetical protein
LVITTILLAACQITPPAPIITRPNVEFTLAPGQTATLDDNGMTIKFISVSSDQRCPNGMECFASGPVTVSLSVQQGNEPEESLVLQTFTDGNGRAPEMHFEGVDNSTALGNFLIQVKAVTPYPQGHFGSIKDRDYRVTLLVTQK